MKKRFVIASAATVLALGAGFWGGWVSHQPSSVRLQIGSPRLGSISGHLYAVGGPSDRTYRLTGEVFVSGVSGGRKLRVVVGPDSEYSVNVPAGTYTLTGRSPQFNSGRTPCWPASSVTVSDGRAVTANVLCQMK